MNNLKLPIEYLPLHNKGKNTSQGSIELFIEPFPYEIAAMNPASHIEKPTPLEYEIRIVVWECVNVPIPPGEKCISMYVTVSQDQFGWVGDTVTKETDCHNGSEDGKGIFNWRMKFPL